MSDFKNLEQEVLGNIKGLDLKGEVLGPFLTETIQREDYNSELWKKARIYGASLHKNLELDGLRKVMLIQVFSFSYELDEAM